MMEQQYNSDMKNALNTINNQQQQQQQKRREQKRKQKMATSIKRAPTIKPTRKIKGKLLFIALFSHVQFYTAKQQMNYLSILTTYE